MVLTEEFLILTVAAFAGGAFGASVGALNSFAFTGFFVVVGEVLNIAQTNIGDGVIVDITADVAFGVVLGPHVAFAGGAGAAAYAAKRGYTGRETGEYHPAKNIVEGLGTRLDVLAVGAAFGAVGFAFTEASVALDAPYDPVAAGVVVSALVHRLALGYSVIGEASLRLRGEVWLPHQSSLSGVAGLGIAVGVLGGYIAHTTGSAFLAFGLSAASLALMCAGVSEIPVTHHITLPASTAAVALTGISEGVVPIEAMNGVGSVEVAVVGATFGVLGALSGELVQRTFYAGAETHLDPPAASIVLTTFLIAILGAVGILPGTSWVPMPT